MCEIEWINDQGDKEMNDVKVQKIKREWVPFTVMSEQLL
ncbi:YolD-like family protein, partial [Bacillus wiedmannii]